MPEETIKQHYYLFATELSFMESTGENGGVTRINTLVLSDSAMLKARQIARVQQTAQVQLREKLNDMNLVILNAVIMNINYLGYMSQEEWQEGMPQLQAEHEAAVAAEEEATTQDHAPVTAFDVDPSPVMQSEAANELDNAPDAELNAEDEAVQEAEIVEPIEPKAE